jgi:hypothetical protein
MSVAVSTLAQIYENPAADCTRAAEQTNDPVFRNMLLTLAFSVGTGCAGKTSDAIDAAENG